MTGQSTQLDDRPPTAVSSSPGRGGDSPAASPLAPKVDGLYGTSPWLLSTPIVRVALCWIAGIAVGHFCTVADPWLLEGALAGLAAVVMALLGRRRGVRVWSSLALLALGGAWVILSSHYVDPSNMRQFLSDKPRLAQVTGRVEGWPRIVPPSTGQDGSNFYRGSSSTWVLDVLTIIVDHQSCPASGRLQVRMDQPDSRLHDGDDVRATGWLQRPGAPANPGEFDSRALLDQQDLAGYLTLRRRDDWELIAPADFWRRCLWAPALLCDAASDSLRLGMTGDPLHLQLLEALLLGRRGDDFLLPSASGSAPYLEDSFRRAGLAYLMAISGAHLAVLLGLVWLAARLICPTPRRTALVVLLALALYLLIVPAHVPILRSGFMAAMICLAYAVGRRVHTLSVLALSAFLLLIWRPNDLFDAGFQLSFVVVAAVWLFVPATARWIWSRPMTATGPDRPSQLAARWISDYLAFNLVAALFAFPLVAYHFGVINPLGLGLSLFSFPLVALVMALGFCKILLGLIFPSLGLLLAFPLQWTVNWMTAPITTAAAWPRAQLTLTHPPSALWAIAALIVLTGMFSGWFFRRRLALLLCAGLCAFWLAAPDLGWSLAWDLLPRSPVPSARLTAIAVGDGSCLLLRLNGGAEPYTLMFDCGSREDPAIGRHAIVPALRNLGIGRINTLVIADADTDYFRGSLDVMDQLPVDRVLTTYYVLDAAHARPHGAIGALVQGVRQRGVPIQTVVRGWRQQRAGGEIEALWPPPDLNKPHAHETCLVLVVRALGRRLLFNGDVGRAAVAGMLAAKTDLRADISDLPYQADFMGVSHQWLASVQPSIVLQSAGPHGLSPDRWAGFLNPLHVTRLITSRQGMTSVEIDSRGKITWSAFQTTAK